MTNGKLYIKIYGNKLTKKYDNVVYLLENAKEKIQKKGCDFLVANDISRKDIGFSSDMNEVYILDKNLKISHIERDTKLNIARKILEKIFE